MSVRTRRSLSPSLKAWLVLGFFGIAAACASGSNADEEDPAVGSEGEGGSAGEETTEGAVKQRKTLLDTIATELTIHETIEERLLYPALKEHPETRDIVLEGVEEHHVANVIMKELTETPVTDEQWGAKFKVFKENIEHHIEEEEGPMFRTARGVMTQEDLLALGRRMAEMKRAAQQGKL